MGTFLKELNIAEILEYDAFKVWKKIDLGTNVYLKKDNYSEKIYVCLPNEEQDVILGVLPKDELEPIDKFANSHWPIEKMFDCLICRKDANIGKYDQKLHILIQIRDITPEVNDSIVKLLKEE